MPIDMFLLKDFRCVLTVPKGVLVRQQQKDGSWLVVQSPKDLRVLYCPFAADSVSAESGCLRVRFLRLLQQKKVLMLKMFRYLQMMFAGRASAANANILFDTGVSTYFVSKSFAKQTGITIRLVEYYIRLADDKTMEVAGT
jgi:hypothetical protein